jgi:hypothetical protein
MLDEVLNDLEAKTFLCGSEVNAKERENEPYD